MVWRIAGPVVAVVVAIAAGSLLTPSDGATEAAPPEPVAVTSDAPRAASLQELAGAADLVVRAKVVGVERGRVFGEPGGGAVVSRVVTLEVADVLRGPTPGQPVLRVEEEGWLEDGTPLIVDGLAPSAVGDDGIWFLTAVGTVDAPVYVVGSAEGRYLVDDDGLVGATGDDPLVAELAALSVEALTARIAALPTPTG